MDFRQESAFGGLPVKLDHQTVSGLLRTWAPRLSRVLYGHWGRPDTSYRLSAEGRVEEDRCGFGEDRWKRV